MHCEFYMLCGDSFSVSSRWPVGLRFQLVFPERSRIRPARLFPGRPSRPRTSTRGGPQRHNRCGRPLSVLLAASGHYEIRGAKTGFTEEVRTGVHLVVGQSATVDLSLQVGESSQQVTVNGDAPLVERDHRGHLRAWSANSRSRIFRSTGAVTTNCSR